MNGSNLNVAMSCVPNINVRMVCRNVKTGEITRTIEKHNRFLKSGILRNCPFSPLNGEFNTSTPLQIEEHIPRYFALGSNRSSSSNNGGVTSEVTVNDTRLLTELNYPRNRLIQRNIVVNRYNDPYIKLIIRHYIPVGAYVDEWLAEAGLFTTKEGNSAVARITFDGFKKDDETVIDVTWEITIVSIESEDEAYVGVDKTDLFTAMENALAGIGRKYNDVRELCATLRKSIVDYKAEDTSQITVDEDTQKLQELSYPLDTFVQITEPIQIPLGSVVKYNSANRPEIIETSGNYPCGNYLELNDSTYNMFGLFTNNGLRYVIGYARKNNTTGVYEYSNIIYDSAVASNGGWVGTNNLGIRSVDEKITKITTGHFISEGDIQINDWNWEEDWRIKSNSSGELNPDDPANKQIVIYESDLDKLIAKTEEILGQGGGS